MRRPNLNRMRMETEVPLQRMVDDLRAKRLDRGHRNLHQNMNIDFTERFYRPVSWLHVRPRGSYWLSVWEVLWLVACLAVFVVGLVLIRG